MNSIRRRHNDVKLRLYVNQVAWSTCCIILKMAVKIKDLMRIHEKGNIFKRYSLEFSIKYNLPGTRLFYYALLFLLLVRLFPRSAAI